MKRTAIFLLLLATLCSLVAGLCACEKKEEERSRYEIKAEYTPDTQTVNGELKFVWKNTASSAADALKFNLWANSYREDAAYKPISPAYVSAAYYAGKNYGGTEILNVSGGKSWEVTGEDANVLCVELEKTVFPEECVSVEIAFSVKLAKVAHRTGVAKNSVNLGNVFPILCAYTNEGFAENPYYGIGDPFCSDTADYDVVFVAPKAYEVAFSGKVTDKRTLGEKCEYAVRLENARDFAIVLSDSFETERCVVGGTELIYYYYNDDAPAARLAAAKECLAYYASTFGTYPYETYSVVQTGLCHGGMEYPGLSMICDSSEEDDLLYTIAHETAHQWWYAAVGSDQVNEAWQDEGLAEYSTAMFFDSHPAYGMTEKELALKATERYRAYYDVYGRVFGLEDTRMTRSLKEYISEYEYASIAYDKGMLLFHTLRDSIGKKRFEEGLRTYYRSFCFKNATAADLIGCFEKNGSDVAGLFSSFLDGKAVI